jgi:hypothetical protein
MTTINSRIVTTVVMTLIPTIVLAKEVHLYCSGESVYLYGTSSKMENPFIQKVEASLTFDDTKSSITSFSPWLALGCFSSAPAPMQVFKPLTCECSVTKSRIECNSSYSTRTDGSPTTGKFSVDRYSGKLSFEEKFPPPPRVNTAGAYVTNLGALTCNAADRPKF